MGDPPQEQDNLLPRLFHHTVGPRRLATGNGVVDDGHFSRVDAIALHDHALCQMAHGNDMVRFGKAQLFHCKDIGIHATAAAVKLKGVDMKDEGASAFLTGLKGRVDGEPLVGVDDIKGVPPARLRLPLHRIAAPHRRDRDRNAPGLQGGSPRGAPRIVQEPGRAVAAIRRILG